MKFAIKAEGRDFAVPAIEAFWWAEAEDLEPAGGDLTKVPPERWRWRLHMPVPAFVGGQDVEAANASALERKGYRGDRFGEAGAVRRGEVCAGVARGCVRRGAADAGGHAGGGGREEVGWRARCDRPLDAPGDESGGGERG